MIDYTLEWGTKARHAMKICFLASPKAAAQAARNALVTRYGQTSAQDADCLVSVGGDGTVLKALQLALACRHRAVFGMRVEGSVGALLNPYSVEDLPQRVQSAQPIVLHPLKVEPIAIALGARARGLTRAPVGDMFC